MQEQQAERAAELLSRYLPPQATVVRAGRQQVVDAAELVPGDVLVLVEGDRVSADARLLSGSIEVGNVPEGPLPTITLALGVGVRVLARQGALVKRLSAVETLGSTTVICCTRSAAGGFRSP